jgi:hypothetical protein
VSIDNKVAPAIFNKESFKRAEKELAAIRNILGCRLLHGTEPEYPQTLLQIHGQYFFTFAATRKSSTCLASAS